VLYYLDDAGDERFLCLSFSVSLIIFQIYQTLGTFVLFVGKTQNRAEILKYIVNEMMTMKCDFEHP
jgi:hypothetical protein